MIAMEYSIGSLSDLITGSNTPNKKKVIKKEFVVPANEEETGENTEETQRKSKKKKHKRKSLEETPAASDNDCIDPETNGDENTEETERKSKKKKHKRKSLEETPAASDNDCIDPETNGDENTSKKKRPKSKKRKLPKTDGDNDEEEESSVPAKKVKHEQPDPEREARTVFVGNVPLSAKKSALKKFFTKYGKVDAVRYRGLPVADPKVPKKVAFIKNEFHKDRASCIAYIRFVEEDSAKKALEANGHLFEQHHLKVNMSRTDQRPDESKAIFLGNISFNAEEEDLWKLFEPCGTIESVRIVRDKRSGIGKGFGYINFKSSDAVQLALEMGDVKYKDRVLRISMCNRTAAKKNKKKDKLKAIDKPGKPKKTFKKDRRQKVDTEGGETQQPKSAPKPASTSFQGSKFTEKKKKNKLNKGAMKKKIMVKKITPKPKNLETQE